MDDKTHGEEISEQMNGTFLDKIIFAGFAS